MGKNYQLRVERIVAVGVPTVTNNTWTGQHVNHVFCIEVSVQLVSPDAFTHIATIQHSTLPYAVKINMC